MKTLFKAILRLPFTLALAFVTVATLRALLSLRPTPEAIPVLKPFLAGFTIAIVVFLLLWKLKLLYVFGHELTHWLLAKLFRRRTGKFRIGLNSGAVEIENPNLWITLGPYIIPIFTLLWCLAAWLTKLFLKDPEIPYDLIIPAGVGVTFAYHVRLTAFAVTRREQPDLQVHGTLFSLAFILCCNVLLVFSALALVSPSTSTAFQRLWILHEQQYAELLALFAGSNQA
jgi:hypothetical protein